MADQPSASPAGEVGKREFVRALSVDENDNDIAGARAAAVEQQQPESPPQMDLRFQTFDPEVHPAGWWEPEATHLSVRDENYLNDRKKRKSAPAVFECVEVECYHLSLIHI